MSLASDLDLILVYGMPPASETSDGPRPLPAVAYYTRLAQRLIGAITAPTGEGQLYEVDMRLRPSGESGPIACSLESFAVYQRGSAWTWEHMALTRARPNAGDAALRGHVAAAIATALTLPRDPGRLVADVAAVRARIAREHPHPSPWDLRNRRGGLLDLEFAVQYLMLREAARQPQVLRRDTAGAIAALGAAAVLPLDGARQLGDALVLFRNVHALLALFGAGAPDPATLAGPVGATLARCAGAVDLTRLDADITEACARTSGWYERLVARPAAQAEQPDTGGVAR
jgi:glutamate-ammonia-ligase adenylyltransferase